MYILSPVDCSTWVDPAGCLPENWNIIYDINGNEIDLCKLPFE
jgi:hypothetical protein